MLSSAARRLYLARPPSSSAAHYATGAGDARPASTKSPASWSTESRPDNYPSSEFDPALSENSTVKPQPVQATQTVSEDPAASGSARDKTPSASEQQEHSGSRQRKWQELYGKAVDALDSSSWASKVDVITDSEVKATVASSLARMVEMRERGTLFRLPPSPSPVQVAPKESTLSMEQRRYLDGLMSYWRLSFKRGSVATEAWSDLSLHKQKTWMGQWSASQGLNPTEVDRNTELAKCEFERRQLNRRTHAAAAQAQLQRVESGWIPPAVRKLPRRASADTSSTDAPPSAWTTSSSSNPSPASSPPTQPPRQRPPHLPSPAEPRVADSTSSTDAPAPASTPTPSTPPPASPSPIRPSRQRPPHLPSPAEPRVADSRRDTPSLDSYPHAVNTKALKAAMASLEPFLPPPPIATLAHGLDRVLFNPGVHFLRDPRSGVYNFSPTTLENVPKLEDFDFTKLPAYVTASKDAPLMELAAGAGKKFVGSTSTTVGMLCQIYLWLSNFKPVNTSMLSAEWATESKTFSMGQRLPVSIIMHLKDGRYAIDSDKSIDLTSDSNVLGEYGHLMEKLLTTEPAVFERFLKSSSNPARSEADDRQAYHYMSTEHMVLRSQLDAQNEHLPNRTFDVKTRGSVAVRQDRQNWEAAAGYSIDSLRGTWGSFEREYYDLIRSAFLKYQFQARIGGMDGVIVAYHSTSKFFGFQYCPIREIDDALFGAHGNGSNIFRTCVGIMEQILLEVTTAEPDHSLELTFAAEPNVLRIFVQKHLPDVDVDSRPSPTMYEFRATSFEAGPNSTMIPFEFGTGGRKESWTTGFAFEKHSGDGDLPTRDLIKTRLGAVREVQQMFNRILLPDGVTEADVVQAAMRARESGVELDPSDLSLRFPFKEGVSYTSKPSYIVSHLRRLASRGNAKEPRRKSIVKLRTVVEVQKL